MSPPVPCPNCGAAVLPDAVAGQCPRCLLAMATAAEEDPDLAGSAFDPDRRRFGDYVLVRQIGAGGMGVVYEARRLTDNCKVAVKLIRDAHAASAVQLRRFAMEAEVVARLDHPHIVRIHEIGDCDGPPFFSMDFIEGESLNLKMARNDFALKRADEQAEVARLMAKIARAVHHAHLRGVLHRDLKPANVLIDPQGEPHLTDFGLAKIFQQGGDEEASRTLTASGDIPGTPSYMSPEQVSDTNVGCGADIYGLGAILYALLTGRPPFQGPTPLDIFKQIVAHPPLKPRVVNPALHPALETVCLKCLEKDPRHRYSSAEAFAEDLESFAQGRAIKARPANAVHRARQWVKHNPVGAALIASLCLGLCVSLVLLKVVNDQRREIQLDRDLTFDEGMQKISRIWREPATRSVTISARELAILAGRSPVDIRGARHQLTLGVSADDGPSSMAQRYARLLGSFQEQMERELAEKAVLHLVLFKRFNQNEDTLARGEVDFMVLSAVDFLQAQTVAPSVAALAQVEAPREAVIFTRTNSGVQQLADLKGRSMVFPDPGLSLTVWAKSRLVEAGVRAQDLHVWTNIVDQGPESGQTVVSTLQTIDRVLRGEFDAGVARRGQFERYRHLGLMMLDRFHETPNVLAARAGLDFSLVNALRSVVGSSEGNKSWPDIQLALETVGENGSNAVPMLDALRLALRQAEHFQLPAAP